MKNPISDDKKGSKLVRRGGSFLTGPRLTARISGYAQVGSKQIGFRIVRNKQN
jgi:hypothetical protein